MVHCSTSRPSRSTVGHGRSRRIVAFGSPKGRTGTRIETASNMPSHPIASHAPIPSPARRRVAPTSAAATGTTAPSPWTPPTSSSSASRSSAPGDSTVDDPPEEGPGLVRGGTSDPWVDYPVEDVDREVHEDEHHPEDEDQALELHVLLQVDRLEDVIAHAGETEDHLDHDGAA